MSDLARLAIYHDIRLQQAARNSHNTAQAHDDVWMFPASTGRVTESKHVASTTKANAISTPAYPPLLEMAVCGDAIAPTKPQAEAFREAEKARLAHLASRASLPAAATCATARSATAASVARAAATGTRTSSPVSGAGCPASVAAVAVCWSACRTGTEQRDDGAESRRRCRNWKLR